MDFKHSFYKKNIMKCLSAGVVAVVASLAAPAWAQSAVAGIWSASGLAPNAPGACFLNGSSNGYSLTLFASPNAPTVFSLDITGPFVPSTPTVATFSYGAGLSQTLTGRFISPTDLRFTLDGNTQNNFATFLHGFTAGVTMSLLLGYQAVDFSLAGTSAVVGSLGQCTDAANFNSLPAPWRPANEQPTPTPIYVATPVPAALTPTYVATPTPVAPVPAALTPTYVATPTPVAPVPVAPDSIDVATPTYVAPVSVTPPAPSYARTWYVLDAQDATCNLSQEGVRPTDVTSYIRTEGFIPNIAVNKDDNGAVSAATISYTASNGKDIYFYFFTSLSGCQGQLSSEIQNGDIMPPSQLN